MLLDSPCHTFLPGKIYTRAARPAVCPRVVVVSSEILGLGCRPNASTATSCLVSLCQLPNTPSYQSPLNVPPGQDGFDTTCRMHSARTTAVSASCNTVTILMTIFWVNLVARLILLPAHCFKIDHLRFGITGAAPACNRSNNLQKGSKSASRQQSMALVPMWPYIIINNIIYLFKKSTTRNVGQCPT